MSRGEKRWIELLRKDIRESKETINGPMEEEFDSSESPNLDTTPLMKTEIEFTKVGCILMSSI